MGIGAYASVHGARNGVPWEIAVVLGGLTATVIGMHVRVRGAARQGPLPRAEHAGAAVRDGLGHLARAGDQRRHPGHVAGAADEAARPARHVGNRLLLRRARLVPDRHAVHAEPAPHRARPRAGRGAREGLRRRGDRRAQLPLQAGRLRDLVVHRRRQRRDPDLHVLPRGDAGAVRGQRLDRAARDGDRRRPGQHHRQLLRRRVHPADAGADEQPDRLARATWPARTSASRRWRTSRMRSTAR